MSFTTRVEYVQITYKIRVSQNIYTCPVEYKSRNPNTHTNYFHIMWRHTLTPVCMLITSLASLHTN